jgi:hypothetical protein
MVRRGVNPKSKIQNPNLFRIPQAMLFSPGTPNSAFCLSRYPPLLFARDRSSIKNYATW